MDYLCTGIDVSAKKLQVATDDSEFEVDNTSEGHRTLIQRLRRSGRKARVCLESTGSYGLDLALALDRAVRIEVMVLNPRVARNFAKVLMHRSKTDPIDARVLREYVRRMEFVAWYPPTIEKLELRASGRRIARLIQMRTQEKNRLHAVESCAERKVIRNDIEAHIRYPDPRIAKAGNRYLRAALYMPAHNAIQWEPHVMAFSEHLVENGKTKMQAKVAVMRKLLH
ncbi:MAG: IS110 family transposase, partial [bacterium]|nr:IS110 family transposase [bacterium]